MIDFDETERQLIEVIEQIQREYQKAAEPYVKQLANLRALRPRVMVVDGQTLVPLNGRES